MTDEEYDYIELAESVPGSDWAQANALIAIAKELRTLRQYVTSPPIIFNVGEDYSETQYPYGRQV